MDYISQGNLSVAGILFRFINEELLPGTGIKTKAFWEGLDQNRIARYWRETRGG